MADRGDDLTTAKEAGVIPDPGLRLEAGDLCDGRFEIERLVAHGGMGSVFRARDRRTGRPVAIKILHHLQPEDRARFSLEGRLLAQLRHPRIVGYVAQGSLLHGEPYLALEWVEGPDLATHLRRHGRLSVPDAVELTRGLAEALQVMHARGILHRDVKPANILLRGGAPEGAMLLDFGIARGASGFRLTRTGAFVGTPEYMAPEQGRGGRVGPAADLYGLGCVLFRCLTGEPPFSGAGLTELLGRIMQEPAPRASQLAAEVPDAMDALVAQLLEKDPEARPPGAEAVLLGLEPIRASFQSPDAHIEGRR